MPGELHWCTFYERIAVESTWGAFTWSAVLRLSLTFRNFLTCAIVSRDEQRMYLRSSSLTGCSAWTESSLKQNNLSLSSFVDLFVFLSHWLIDRSIDWLTGWLAGWLAGTNGLDLMWNFFGCWELVGNNNGVLRAKSISFKGLVSFLSWRNYCFEI